MSRPAPRHRQDRAVPDETTARKRRIALRKQRGQRGGRGWQVLKRGTISRAMVVFIAAMALFYGFLYSPTAGAPPFEPYLAFLARITGAALNLLGLDINVSGTLLEAPAFSMEIVPGCDAIEPIAAYICAVLASPVLVWSKLPGIVVGVLALSLVNLGRLVSLFFVKMFIPSVFDMMHEEIWQAGVVLVAVVFWVVWVQWATSRGSGAALE